MSNWRMDTLGLEDTRAGGRLTLAAAVCAVLAGVLLACTGGGGSTGSERALEAEARVRSLEDSVAALAEENAELRGESEALRVELEHRDARIEELEEAASKIEWDFPALEWDFPSKEKLPDGTVLERTAKLAEDAGGEVHYVDHPERGRAVLVAPVEFVDGETPLIVSLHGFGGNSADHAAYVPLHERVHTDGFALLLPNGQLDGQGNRFWNPTDRCCEGGKSGEDDVAYLTELVAEARKAREFGPVYFFGYSNGGFMSHHVACKGLPGLRAAASLAGTSYVEDSSCEGAPPVSVLHVHGTADDVVLYEGDRAEPDPKGDGGPAFYAGAQEMVTRWSRRIGCEWPEDPQPYDIRDLDRYVPGAETQAFRLDAGCAEGIRIELWVGVGSSHAPGYGEAFADALAGWFLSQE